MRARAWIDSHRAPGRPPGARPGRCRRPRGHRRARLHDLGARRLGRRARRRRRPRPAGRPRDASSMDRVRSAPSRVDAVRSGRAALQVLIARLTGIATRWARCWPAAAFSPNIKERADRSAALFTPAGELLVQAEHIPVHLGSMPASVAVVIDALRARHRRLGAGRGGGAGRAQRPVRRRHPSERHHPRRRLRASTAASSGGWPTGPTTPTSAGRRRARSRPTPSRSSPRACGCRRCCLTDEVAAVLVRQLADAGRAARRPRRPGRRQRRRRRAAGGARRRAPRRGARSTASDGCGPRSPPCPTASGPSPTWSTRSVPVPSSRPSPRSRVAVTGRRRRRSPSTSPAPTPSGSATSTRSRPVTVSAVDLRAALRRRPRPSRPTAVRSDRSRCSHRAGHDRRRPPARRRRRRQRRGQPAGRRRVPRCARPGRAGTARRRLAGHHEQPADRRHRRRRPAVGVLRDRRRRAGRPGAGPGDERRAHRR